MLSQAITALSIALVLYGTLGLISMRVLPSLADSWLFGRILLTGRLRATRRNKALMLTWLLLAGIYFLLAGLDAGWAKYVVGVMFLALTFWLLRKVRYERTLGKQV